MTSRKRRTNNSDTLLESVLFKWGTRLLLGLGVIVMFLTLAQCTIEKPESPSWSTQLVVPVVNRTYAMDELVSKIGQDEITINDSGEVAFSIVQELDTVGLSTDILTTGDLAYSVGQQLGPIDITPPVVAPVNVSLSTLAGLAIVLPGDIAIVPDTVFQVVTDIPTLTSFTSATFNTGRIDVVITNDLGINLDNITIELRNKLTGSLITLGTYPGVILSGQVGTVPLVLDGVSVPSDIRLIGFYHTPMDTITSFSTRAMQTEMVFSDTLQVNTATAMIPALTRLDSAIVPLAETDRIDSASLASGTLSLTIFNGTSLSGDLNISVPDLRSGGTPLAITQTVSAGQTATVNLDLSNYDLVPRSAVVPQNIGIYVDMSTQATTIETTVSALDSFSVSAGLSNLTFNSVTGQFQSVVASLDSISQQLNVPTGFDSVELVSAVLTLEIDNGIDLPGAINIRIDGNNGKSMIFGGNVTPRGLATATTSIIVDTTAADFFAPIPTMINASGSVTFGDGAYVGTITANDFVAARIRIDAPLEMIINQSTIDTDIERQAINQTDINKITDHFINGRFVYTIINHLPLGAYVNIFIGPDSTTLYTAPQLSFDSLYVTAAPVDIFGVVSDTAQTDLQEIYIDSADVRILENDTLFIGQEIVLTGSGGQAVKLSGSDYITVQGSIQVEYNIDGSF